jgi:hypothetical protein
LGITAALLPVFILSMLIVIEERSMERQIISELDQQLRANLIGMARDIFALCQSQQESIQASSLEEVSSSLREIKLLLRVAVMIFFGGHGDVDKQDPDRTIFVAACSHPLGISCRTSRSEIPLKFCARWRIIANSRRAFLPVGGSPNWEFGSPLQTGKAERRPLVLSTSIPVFGARAD